MSDRYQMQTFKSVVWTTATTGQVFGPGPICVQEYETLCLGFRNEFTATVIGAIHVQGAFETDANASAGSGAPNWVDIVTTTLAWPSSVAASATVITPVATNGLKYIRVLFGVTATPNVTISGGMTLWVGGHKHHG